MNTNITDVYGHPLGQVTLPFNKTLSLSAQYQTTILRLQIISSTLIILISTGTIAYMVNHTNYNYNPNIYDNLQFNVLWGVIVALGVLHLLFSLKPNLYEAETICEQSKVKAYFEDRKYTKMSLRALTTMISIIIHMSHFHSKMRSKKRKLFDV